MLAVFRHGADETAALAAKLDVRLHTHLADRRRKQFCEQLYGVRPLDYLEDCGWLSRTWLAHGVHFSADEMPRLAKGGVSISHCACSNQTLGSGACPCAISKPPACRSVLVSMARPRRRIQSDAGSARGIPVAAWTLSCAQGQPQGCFALGDSKGSAACVGRPELGEIADWRCSSSMNCAFPATAIRSRLWLSARIAPTG